MKNDSKTFEAIVKEYSEPLYWHIRRMVVSHEDARDILQDTFIRAFSHLWQLRDKDALKPWLYRIASNEVNRYFKKAKRGVLTDEQLNEGLVEKLMDSEYVDYQQEAEVKLQKALLTLSELQRTVFILRYYDDMDYGQISYVTGSKPETLKVSYHQAKEKIKKYLSL